MLTKLPGSEFSPTDWHWLETDTFRILSDAKQKDLEEFAVNYAAFRWIMQEQVLGPAVKQPPSLLLLFRRQSDFQEHVPESTSSNSRTITYTIEVDDTAVTALSIGGDRNSAMETLIEFETIWMLGRVGVWVPNWMAQGTGEVLSTLRLNKGRCVIGAPSERLTYPLERYKKYLWPRFFSLSSDSPEYHGLINPGAYHGQAWELMHWVLLSGEGGQLRFEKLAAQLHSTLAIPAIEQLMGVPAAKFSEAIFTSLRQPLKSLPFDDKPVRAAWRIAPAPEAEVQAHLADLLSAAQKPAASARALARAQALAPGSVSALEARAHLELRHGDIEQAAASFRQAIEAGSKNPFALLLSARVRLDASSVGGGTDYPGGGGANVPIAIGEIRQALALSPGDRRAYEALGRAFFIAQKIDDSAIHELTPGVAPGRSRVRHYRALLYERLNRFDESVAEFRAVIADPECSAELRRSSEARITAVIAARHRHEVDALLESKQYANAHLLLEAAMQSNPEQRTYYADLAKWADSRERAEVLDPLRESVEILVLGFHFQNARAVLDTAESAASDAGLKKEISRLRAGLEQSARLHQLDKLFAMRRWAEYHELVQAYLKDYPQSREAETLRRNDETAQAEMHAGKISI